MDEGRDSQVAGNYLTALCMRNAKPLAQAFGFFYVLSMRETWVQISNCENVEVVNKNIAILSLERKHCFSLSYHFT
jgi:hypothetical protein